MVGTAWLNGWYPGANSFEFSIRTPGGYVTPFQGVIPESSPLRNYALPGAKVRIATPGLDPANSDHNFLVQILGVSLGLPVRGGIWRLRVRNTFNLTQIEIGDEVYRNLALSLKFFKHTRQSVNKSRERMMAFVWRIGVR